MADVVTGYLADDLGRADRVPIPRHQYVFSPDRPPASRFSRPVVLAEGRLHLFRAYGLEAGERIFVNAVSRGSLAPPWERSGSDPPDSGVDLYVQRMTLGGAANWEFSAERPQLLINLPGLYRFELEFDEMRNSGICLEYLAVSVAPGAPPGVIG